MRTCDRPRCDNRHYARGLCHLHYHRRYHGRPEPHTAPATSRKRTTYARGGKPC